MYSIANVISSPDVFVFAAERFVMSLGKALEPYERMQADDAARERGGVPTRVFQRPSDCLRHLQDNPYNPVPLIINTGPPPLLKKPRSHFF